MHQSIGSRHVSALARWGFWSATAFTMLATSGPALALRSTKVEGYTDPDFEGYRAKIMLLMVLGADMETRQTIEARAEEQFGRYGVKVITERSLFPPTREWSSAARAEILQDKLIDSALIIAAGAGSTEVIPFARQTFGSSTTNANVYDSGAMTADSSGQSTSFNLVMKKSSAEFSAVLTEVASGRTVWFGDILTKAGGALFVGQKGDAKAAVKGVIDGLLERGHIARK